VDKRTGDVREREEDDNSRICLNGMDNVGGDRGEHPNGREGPRNRGCDQAQASRAVV